MIKSNKKRSDDNYFISVGLPETPQKGDFDYENFPSKLGGLPIWLTPPDVDLSYFECQDCKQNLYFLIQIYCPLEEYKHTYHRTIYVFFCKECWKKNNALKILKVQLPEKSEYYQGDKLLIREKLEKNETIININKKINVLSPEYLIDSVEEIEEASNAYIKFYDKLDEKSLHSKSDFEDDSDDEDYLPNDPSISDEKIKKMVDNYEKEQESNKGQYTELEEDCDNEIIAKLQKNIFKNAEDIIYQVFAKVLSYDPKQVLRYCRDDVIPLWFTNNGMLTTKNTKCKNCGGEVIFEFQIMPNIFNLYKEIFNIDIGTIVVYTCKKSCTNKKNMYTEEYAFIQRTGEKIIDLNKPMGGSSNITNTVIDEEFAKNLNKLTVKGNANNEPDEDGWVEVKKKAKK